MRTLLVILALLAATATADPTQSTVMIAGIKGISMSGTGSGAVINKGTVLTCNHVAKMANKLVVKDAAGNWHNATVTHRGSPDWAVLSVPTLNAPILHMDRDGVKEGEQVWAIGRFRDGQELRYSHGVINSWMFQTSYQHATTQVYPGYSGGPVIDANGRIVGIVSMETPQGTCLYVPVGAVK